MINCEQELL